MTFPYNSLHTTYAEAMEVQYRSKLSYHPSSRFSKDETLVWRDPFKRIVWYKLQAASLQESDEFLATLWSLPCESIWYYGNCFSAASRETNVDLQAKSLSGEDECQKRSRKLAFGIDIALFLHCNVLASHKYERQLLNGNLLRKTQVLSLLMKKLDGNNFYISNWDFSKSTCEIDELFPDYF